MIWKNVDNTENSGALTVHSVGTHVTWYESRPLVGSHAEERSDTLFPRIRQLIVEFDASQHSIHFKVMYSPDGPLFETE